jgi:hypothetical protein
MKKTSPSKTNSAALDDMRSEYSFDYRKARPNRFAARKKDRLTVVLDPDVSKVFTTPESVNTVLRALIATMPQSAKRKAAAK